jgi:hypothetical protein
MLSSSTQIEFELERGERQLWAGVPRQGIVFRPADVFMIPFTLLWAGFAVFWESSVLRTNAPGFFALWGIPFVLVGIYITVGRFFFDASRRRKTTYGLTSSRVIIATGRTTKSLNLATLSDVTLTERADGSGTITFGPTTLQQTMYSGMAWPGVQQVPAFELIPDAKAVYQMIRQAQQGARPA